MLQHLINMLSNYITTTMSDSKKKDTQKNPISVQKSTTFDEIAANIKEGVIPDISKMFVQSGNDGKTNIK